LKKQAGSDLGQPGLEIPIYPEEESDALYMEVYHWALKPGAAAPESILPRLAVLIGEKPLEEEKSRAYFKRMASENKGQISEAENGNEKSITYKAPLKDMPVMEAVAEIVTINTEKGVGMKEISLDVKIPFDVVGKWLGAK
jgi:hypothetical protein